jgi:hypothetical protein
MRPTGEVKKRISIYDALEYKLRKEKLYDIYRWIIHPTTLLKMMERRLKRNFVFEGLPSCPADIFHVNTVEIIEKDIEGLCKKGDLLVCIRNLDLIGILDPEKEAFVWRWGPGELRMPHHPTLLESGNILIFDNGWEREYSRVVEINPLTKELIWEYRAEPPEEFFSLKRGSNQRLPNGNTLIAESDRGHIFEVTSEGKVVWEFYGHLDETGEARRLIYRFERILDPESYSCLEKLENDDHLKNLTKKESYE